MMNQPKIQLSPLEIELVSDTNWILTKNEIIRKTSLLLGMLSEEQKKIVASSSLPQEAKIISPKIAKGENYKGLPWLMLDHPRLFNKENILAIRTMLWWGNFFSITLHLAGEYKKTHEQMIASSYVVLKEKDIYCCINDDPWQHHFEKENYILVNDLKDTEFSKIIAGRSFIKLSAKISLDKWDDAIQLLSGNFKFFLNLLK